jgi:hypothetical protein
MKYQEKCECCGHIKTAFMHSLNSPLVEALYQLVNFYEDNNRGCCLQDDLNLTKNQYNNFQKLQYFFLVQQTPNGWFPTQDGIKFIYGEHRVLNPVITLESQVLDIYHPAWKTARRRIPKLVGVEEIDNKFYKKRSEYQLEKSRQGNLIFR